MIGADEDASNGTVVARGNGGDGAGVFTGELVPGLAGVVLDDLASGVGDGVGFVVEESAVVNLAAVVGDLAGVGDLLGFEVEVEEGLAEGGSAPEPAGGVVAEKVGGARGGLGGDGVKGDGSVFRENEVILAANAEGAVVRCDGEEAGAVGDGVGDEGEGIVVGSVDVNAGALTEDERFTARGVGVDGPVGFFGREWEGRRIDDFKVAPLHGAGAGEEIVVPGDADVDAFESVGDGLEFFGGGVEEKHRRFFHSELAEDAAVGCGGDVAEVHVGFGGSAEIFDAVVGEVEGGEFSAGVGAAVESLI